MGNVIAGHVQVAGVRLTVQMLRHLPKLCTVLSTDLL